ncbi:hypothetical protein [Zoogloea sp.]|uniref:hypothetical protein n=1 Tax=Zoogloea sp. TaxID=49181 RepID=UPI0035B1FBBB
MKINLIPLGTRFEYEGEIYTKTGPMTAATEKGGQRMIPRYAVLKPVGEMPPAPPPAPGRQVDVAQIRTAFDAYHAVALRLADDFARPELEAARQGFLKALGD